MTTQPADPALVLDEIAERLESRFPALPREAIRNAIDQASDHFARARVKDFLPVLIEREAKARLERPL